MTRNFSYDDINKVLLEKKSRFAVDESFSSSKEELELVLSIGKNIEDLGFVFSKELFDALKFQPRQKLIDAYKLLVQVLARMVGGHVEHKPFYKNFPQQVMAMSEVDLYMNALVHYWTDGTWIPEYVEQMRFPIEDGDFQIKTIKLGSAADFHQLFVDMMSGKGSLSPDDQKLLGWYIENSDGDDLVGRLPDEVPTRETLSLVLGKILKTHPGKVESVKQYVKTATDVLRLVTYLSDGDLSLADNTRFRNFSRAERRILLSLLEECRNIEEDMARYPEKWIRVGEKLHPGDYSTQFPAAYEAFSKIRKGEKIYSFASEVELALKEENPETVLSLLKQRPGELSRRMDALARAYPEHERHILEAFGSVAQEVSTQVLLQLAAHFKARNEERKTRSFFPKGIIAKVKVIEKPLPLLPDEYCRQVVSVCEDALIQRFASKPALGKVWIDPVLKDIFVPIAQRSSSRSLKTYARGSRFSLPEGVKTIRGFIHWKNVIAPLSPKTEREDDRVENAQVAADNVIIDWRSVLSGRDEPLARTGGPIETHNQIRTDIDLSLGLYDRDWNYINHISYTNPRIEKLDLYHSGDIVDSPEGASEFVDMNVDKLKENGVRYAVFNVYSYTLQGFNETPECFFGWMSREKPESGEIFEPKTVSNKIDLSSPTIICLPVLFDLEKMEAIWMDVSLKSNPRWVNNIEANRNNVVLISKAMAEMNKPTLFDLFRLNATARGKLVNSPEEADIRFGLDEETDVTPFEIEKILTDFM